jgi:hypothetical protein
LRLAERCSDDPEKRRIFIAEVQEGVNRGLRVTSQLLSFAKQQERGLHAVDINEALGNL